MRVGSNRSTRPYTHLRIVGLVVLALLGLGASGCQASPEMSEVPDREVIALTIEKLRETPAPGTVVRTAAEWNGAATDDTNPELRIENAISDETWTTDAGQRSRTLRRARRADSASLGTATETVVYRDGGRRSEITSANATVTPLETPDAQGSTLEHTFEGFISPKCQDCHQTHYTTGTSELLGGGLRAQTEGKSNDELLANLLESSDATVTSSQPGFYSIGLVQPESGHTLDLTVRAKDFQVTEWRVEEGGFQRFWILRQRETLPAESLPADFFDSPVPLKEWPATAEE
jgi:hypothetical protein